MGCDRLGDFGQMQVHRFGVAEGQDQSRGLSLLRADGSEDVGRGGALIPRSAWASAALGPPTGESCSSDQCALHPRTKSLFVNQHRNGDPCATHGKHLISLEKFVRGAVRVGADRDPGLSRAFSVRSMTYAEIKRGPHFGADSQL